MPPSLSVIFSLSLHDALPIFESGELLLRQLFVFPLPVLFRDEHMVDHSGQFLHGEHACVTPPPRSEEHTSELQSHSDLVCRLLLEKKKNKNNTNHTQLNE